MRNKPKVVIDTNIFIKSWFDNEEICNEIIYLVDHNNVKLLFSQETIGELFYIVKKYSIRYMSSKNPRMQLLNGLSDIFYEADSVNTLNTKCPKINDPYDEMFLKTAIEGNADFLVSDDFKSGLHELDNLDFKVFGSRNFLMAFKLNFKGIKTS